MGGLVCAVHRRKNKGFPTLKRTLNLGIEKGRLLKNSRPKGGLIQVICYPASPETVDITGFIEKFCIAIRTKAIDRTWVFRWLGVYFVADMMAVFVLKKVGDHPIWYTLMAIIFIVMALYLLWGQKIIRVNPSMVTLVIMAILSGIIMGMFGVGGPLMAAFFLEATHEKEAYLGTSQLVGGCTLGIDFLMRMFNGMFPVNLFGFSLLGVLAMVAGLLIAKGLVSRMDALMLRKIICVVILVDGIIMLFNHV